MDRIGILSGLAGEQHARDEENSQAKCRSHYSVSFQIVTHAQAQ
jgi:hypothetical protein